MRRRTCIEPEVNSVGVVHFSIPIIGLRKQNIRVLGKEQFVVSPLVRAISNFCQGLSKLLSDRFPSLTDGF
jgi:hypothetical protein